MQKLLIGSLLIFLFGMGVVPVTVRAQGFGDVISSGFCDCFCHSDNGAILVSSYAVGYETCRASCDAIGERSLGCYTSDMVDNRPENNQLCWTRAECASDLVPTEVDGSGNILASEPSIWGGQESFCLENQGYCYNPPGATSEYGGDATVTLGVPIGQLKETGDISSYVEAVYTYLISAASILAVFLMMVGGVQWLMAGGNQGAIGKAKERITNALIGLVLIMSAYLIARLIDPRLVDFNFFAAPKIQTIVFLDESTSCEALGEQDGIEVTPNTPPLGVNLGECGSTGTITVGAGVAGIAGDIDSCNYLTCEDPYASCLRDRDSDTGYSCVRCQDIWDGSGASFAPSALNCGNALSSAVVEAAELVDAGGGYGTGSKAYCMYHNAGAFNDYETDSCLEVVFPEDEDFLNCDLLVQEAAARGSASCRMYDLVFGRSEDILYNTTAELDWLQTNTNDFNLFSTICEEDPCQVGKLAGGCGAYIIDTTLGICSYTIPATDIALFGESSLCQTAADLTYTANCYDNDYLQLWDQVLEKATSGDLIGAAEDYQLLYPTDVNGLPTADPWW